MVYQNSSELYVLLQSTNVLTQQTLHTLLKIFTPLITHKVKKLSQVLSQVKLSTTVLQKYQILLSFVITLFTVIVELKHRRHITSTSLLILTIS